MKALLDKSKLTPFLLKRCTFYMNFPIIDPSRHFFMRISSIAIFGILSIGYCYSAIAQDKPRVIVSTDIGGTDPDDFQSMIHYLMYADRFQTEGLIASPYGGGRKEDIFKIINLYEKDYSKLKTKSSAFPSPDYLRSVAKQGALERAPLNGWSEATEGSDWIIECAKRKSKAPLWVLVWGGIEDVVQALHDAPEIADQLRVYWIAGPNKKWGADAYHYLVSQFPDLWMIETNATYRGWFVDEDSDRGTNVNHFYEAHIKGRGAMGKDFINYYGGEIKMGDSPSVGYLLHGDPDLPDGESWGGSFVPLAHSSRTSFQGGSSESDTVPTFSLVEWVFQGPEPKGDPEDPSLLLEISGQEFEGYYMGEGLHKVRFVPKSTGNWTYKVKSELPELQGLTGAFVSADPWPGKRGAQDFGPLRGWWSDDPSPENFEGSHQGAKTIFKWQQEFLLDWAERWAWLE